MNILADNTRSKLTDNPFADHFEEVIVRFSTSICTRKRPSHIRCSQNHSVAFHCNSCVQLDTAGLCINWEINWWPGEKHAVRRVEICKIWLDIKWNVVSENLQLFQIFFVDVQFGEFFSALDPLISPSKRVFHDRYAGAGRNNLEGKIF